MLMITIDARSINARDDLIMSLLACRNSDLYSVSVITIVSLSIYKKNNPNNGVQKKKIHIRTTFGTPKKYRIHLLDHLNPTLIAQSILRSNWTVDRNL